MARAGARVGFGAGAGAGAGSSAGPVDQADASLLGLARASLRRWASLALSRQRQCFVRRHCSGESEHMQLGLWCVERKWAVASADLGKALRRLGLGMFEQAINADGSVDSVDSANLTGRAQAGPSARQGGVVGHVRVGVDPHPPFASLAFAEWSMTGSASGQ